MLRSTTVRTAVAALAASLLFVLLPTAPASAATPRIGKAFFGMTDGDPVSWPAAGIGSMRLWDTHVTWRDIETSPGVFDFTRLDAQVAEARAHGARPLLVLGMTPKFHALKPKAPGLYGAGTTSMPKLGAWRTYVRKVVQRYKGQMDYQVWNEANVNGFWTGTPAQLAVLTKVTFKVVNANDSRALVVSPALATRLTGQRYWLRQFYAQRTGGRRVAGWVDVVALHLYPLPKQGPEASMTQLSSARIMLSRLGVRKPIWNTEINYGIRVGGGGTATNISRSREAALVARTYVLNAAANVKRVYWYSWDLKGLANTQLTQSDGVTLAPAGVAYTVVRGWLLGSRIRECARDRRGTYTCVLAYSGGIKRIYWNPSRTVRVRTVPSTRAWVDLQGRQHTLRGARWRKVNASPILVRSKR